MIDAGDGGPLIGKPLPTRTSTSKSKFATIEYLGVGAYPNRNRETAKSKSRIREIANWNRKSKWEACHVSSNRKPRFGIGNRDRNQKSRIGNRKSNRKHATSDEAVTVSDRIFLAGVLTRCDRESRVKAYAQLAPGLETVCF